MIIIAGKDCEDCECAILDESNKAKIMVYCEVRNRWYIFGACISCDDRIKKKIDDD